MNEIFFKKKELWSKAVSELESNLERLNDILAKNPEAIASLKEKDLVEKRLEFIKLRKPNLEDFSL